MKHLRYFALALIASLVFTHLGFAQVGVQVTASARQLCGSAASHELTINWNVTNLRGSAQIIIAITGPDGKTQTLNDSLLQSSKKVNVNYPLGGSVVIKVTAKTSSAEASNTATVVLAPCAQPQGRLTANPKTVCNSRSSHDVEVSWSVSGVQLGNGTILQLILSGPDGKQQTINLNALQGQMTIPLNYPNGGTVTVILALTKTGSAQQILSRTAITLGQCLQANVQLTANPKPVCSSRASHEVEVNWNVSGIAAGTPVAIVVVATGPDGRLQSQQASGAQGKATVLLNYPNGGAATIEVIVRTGASTLSAATRVVLDACKNNGGTETTPPPGFGPGFKIPETPDFVVTDIEVSQGVQNLANEMPLVSRRWTIVRVYVKDLKGIGAGNVTAQLKGELTRVDYTTPDGGGGEFPKAQLGPLNPSNAGGRITVMADGGQRKNLNDSFWFRIPFSWHTAAEAFVPKNAQVAAFTLKFTAEVNPTGPGNLAEQKKDNNTKSVTLEFKRADIFKLRTVPLKMKHTSDTDPFGNKSDNKIYAWDDPKRWEVYHNLFRYHPISDWIVNPKKNAISSTDEFLTEGSKVLVLWTYNGTCSRGQIRSAIETLRTYENWSGRWHYMGTIHPDVTECGGGMAYPTPSAPDKSSSWIRISYTRSDPVNFPWYMGAGNVMGQELGHTEGRDHAPCYDGDSDDITDEQDGGPIDSSYPYPWKTGSKTKDNSDDTLCSYAKPDVRGYYGLDVYYKLWPELPEPTVLGNDPSFYPAHPKISGVSAGIYPTMGYFGFKYMDPYNYCALLVRYGVSCNLSFPSLTLETISILKKDSEVILSNTSHNPTTEEPALNLQAGLTILTISSSVDLIEGTGKIDLISMQLKEAVSSKSLESAQTELRNLSANINQPGFNSEFSVELQNKEGHVLLKQIVPLEKYNHEETIKSSGFVLQLPSSLEATSVVLKHKDKVIDRRTRSANAPQVQVLSPNGGERLKTGDIIRWNANDADGDKLLFNVFFSPDAGNRWQMIDQNVTGSELGLNNLEEFVGTAKGLIRVVANDGFNTGYDLSDNAFTVPGGAPQVTIISPQREQAYTVNDKLLLYGNAQDSEDSLLKENTSALTYLWTSDLNGELGKTQELTIEPNTLKLGKHKITLTVTDSDSMTGQASVEVTIQKEPDRGPLAVSLTTNAKQTCGDASKGSHELSLNWEATGGQPPVKVTINFTGPDALIDKLSEQPAKGEQTLKLAYPGGGTLKIEVVAEDNTGAKASKPATIQLGACR
jgi:hypothetical protein